MRLPRGDRDSTGTEKLQKIPAGRATLHLAQSHFMICLKTAFLSDADAKPPEWDGGHDCAARTSELAFLELTLFG